MTPLISWFARNGVAATLLMLVIAVGGALAVPRIKKEVFPEVESGRVLVTVAYPGAAPEEVEEGVCVKIEEKVHGVAGLKRITSTAGENGGFVMIELLPGADARRALDEVKARVDALETLPAEAEQPVIQEVLLRRQVINVAVSGDADERTLKRLGERVRDEIAALPGITQVELAVARPYEIAVEVSERALRRHGLTFDDVARAVRRSSLDLPGGSVRAAGGEVLLRTKGQAYRGGDFEDLPLLVRPDGSRVRLGDVARIVDGFAETDQSARFDGRPAVLVQVFRTGDQSALAIADAVKDYCREARLRLPAGIALTTWQDDSVYLRSRLQLLIDNALQGFVLILVTLALFLRLRLAFWVGVGVPLAFLGTLWLLPALDVSINLLSLFGFIVVLGIVGDDAISVAENIQTHREAGAGPVEAAVRGASGIAMPVVFAVLVTVTAFVPLLYISGNMGKFMRVIPLVAIPTLCFSLVESLLILPAHLAHLRPEGPPGNVPGSAAACPERERRIPAAPRSAPARGPAALWRRIQQGVDAGVAWFVARMYTPVLDRALRRPGLAVGASVSLLILSGGLWAGGWIGFQFFPPVDADNAVAVVTMPQGTPVEVTAAAVRQIEDSARRLQAELEAGRGRPPGSVFRHVLASVGEQPYRTDQRRHGGAIIASITGGNLGEVNIALAPSEERDFPSPEIARRWRELTGSIPGAVELSFTASLFSAGEVVNVQLGGEDTTALTAATEKLKARLATYPGVFDIADSHRPGKQELVLHLRPAVETLGISRADLARQVRQAFYGEEAQRVQRGRDDVKVMVRYPVEDRRSLGDLETMRVRAPDGTEVPFSAVAASAHGRGYAAIRRSDRRRVINVTADIDAARGKEQAVLTDLRENVLPALAATHAGLTWSFEGQGRERRESLEGLERAFVIALIGIYALLAIPLKSYLQPLIVMSAIPFGLIGAVWGHLLMGRDLTFLSLFGLVALAGVVITDGIVMVDHANGRRAAGATPEEAARDAGIARFRPIFLISLTTFIGLLPLVTEKSLQAQFLIPMAISLAYGEVVSTAVNLVLMPALILVVERVRAKRGSRQSPVASRQ